MNLIQIPLGEATQMMHSMVESEREAAIVKHGPLQGGMDRWSHHLMEECEEAIDEMAMIRAGDHTIARRLLLASELAQVVQLAETMIIMLIQDRQFQGEETWKEVRGR